MSTPGQSRCSVHQTLSTQYAAIACRALVSSDYDQGGTFTILVTLPKDYPFKPPTLSFKTKIYHPNVSNDDKGSLCLGMLRSDQWKPPNKIVDVLKLVKAILSQPQPDDAVETSIADQYKRDYKTFEQTAKEWTAKYAK